MKVPMSPLVPRRTSSLLRLALLAPFLAACAATPARDPYRRAIPVYEEVEVPVVERRPEPRVAIRFVPEYEEVVEPVVGRHGRVRERRCRRFVGYRPEEIPIGCGWKDVETGTETVRRLVGWRWADDAPWPCEIEAMRRRIEAREAQASEEEEAPEGEAARPGAPAAVDAPKAREAPAVDDLPDLDDLEGLEGPTSPGASSPQDGAATDRRP